MEVLCCISCDISNNPVLRVGRAPNSKEQVGLAERSYPGPRRSDGLGKMNRSVRLPTPY